MRTTLFRKHADPAASAPHPGQPAVLDGSAAVAGCEQAASDASAAAPAGAAARMQALWAEGVRAGRLNAAGRPLRQVETESEPAALAAVLGMAHTGLRTTAFLTADGAGGVRETLATAAGRPLTTVVHLAAQGAGPGALAGHEAYHALADAGPFQLFARDAQAAADLALIAHRIAELALVPGVVAQDAWTTTHRLASLQRPGPGLAAAYLGDPGDEVEAPTAAQAMVWGQRRRRIPELWSVDAPALTGAVHGAGTHAEAVASRGVYALEAVAALAGRAMEEYAALTGRRYSRLGTYRADDADYLLVAQGAVVPAAEALADHLRRTRKLKVGVVDVTMLRPFPGDLLGALLRGRKGVAVLERVDQPLAEDPPLLREVRAVAGKCLENGQARRGETPYPGYAAYARADQAPPLYSALYGLGGPEPSAGALLAAVENMLPQGAGRRRGYLGVAFHRDEAATPKQEIFLQTLADAYPAIRDLELRADGAPDLLPEGALVARVHGIAGRELFPAASHPARLLAELRGLHVSAWREPAEGPRGAPAVWHLAAAAEPVRGHAAAPADVVVCAEASVWRTGRPLAGLKDGGTLVLQSDAETPAAAWEAVPAAARAEIARRGIQAYAIDALGIARAEGGDPDHVLAQAGKVLQGSLLATSTFMQATGLVGKALSRGLNTVLVGRAEEDEALDVEAEQRLYLRGMGLSALPEPPEAAAEAAADAAAMPALPEELKHLAPHAVPALDLHRFWADTAAYHHAGGGANGGDGKGAGLAEPFLAADVAPAATGLLRDRGPERGEYPRWLPEACTGCGACWTLCPDAALPGLVNGIGEVLMTALAEVEARQGPAEHLPRAVRQLEGKLREQLKASAGSGPFQHHLAEAVAATVAASKLDAEGRQALEAEFAAFRAVLRDFPFAVTEPFFTDAEQGARGSGGLLSITLDPARCTGCMACVRACPEEALAPEPQSAAALATQRANRAFWLRLPTTPAQYIRSEPAAEGQPGLETLLLDKRAYGSLVGGTEGAPGDDGGTALHLFAATVEAVLRPQVAEHLQRIEALIEELERHIRLNLAVDVGDTEALQQATAALHDQEFTLSELSAQVDRERNPIDVGWLERVTGLLAALKRLKALYTDEPGRPGRASLGMVGGVAAGGAGRVTYPFHPFPFPWSHLAFQGSPALALGVFEGHMARMAEGFRAVRLTELELAGKYNAEVHEPYFARFSWRDFSDDELALCPPLVLAGGDADLAGAGLDGLSELLRSGRPVKVLALDTQAWRHVARHAADAQPAGGEGADGRPERVGAAAPAERRGSLGLLGLAHPEAFVLQGSLADVTHLLQGFRDGLAARRPALFAVYHASLPGHGGADDRAVDQARAALLSRAHPLLRVDPDAGAGPHERLSLAGNPDGDAPWGQLTLHYLDDEGLAATREVACTYAAYAATVPELQHHFRVLPADAPEDGLTPVEEYIDLDDDERAESRPFVWAADARGRLQRLAVSPALVHATEERRERWQLLRTLVRADIVPVDEDAIAEQARQETVDTVWQNLIELAQGNGDAVAAALDEAAQAAPAAGGEPAAEPAADDEAPAPGANA